MPLLAREDDGAHHRDQNQNGRLDSFEKSTITNAQGNYTFKGLIPATYYVTQATQTGLRLTSPADGYYSYWDTGRQAPLRELLVNEGLAVHVSQMISPGHAAWEYFGFGRRQYARVRELEAVMSRAVTEDLNRAGLGLRLRYLSGGMSDEARTVDRYVLPERSGYFLGARMVEAAITEHGIAWAVRANANELAQLARDAAATA